MKLRIYAVAVTIALVAALTKPSAIDHHDKLELVHWWVNDALMEDAVETAIWRSAGSDQPGKFSAPEPRPEPLPPSLRYLDLGLASAVYAEARWSPCLTEPFSPRMPLSFGVLGFVFTGSGDFLPEKFQENLPSTPVADTSAPNPAGAFFAAYQDYQQAEKLAREGRHEEAAAKFRQVLDQLDRLKTQAPEWQPMVVDFRLKKTRERLASLSPAKGEK